MTIEEIKELVADDESRTLELKKSTGELKDGMRTACAFLNTDGGVLIFGVTPKSLKLVGQAVTDNTQREISLALSGLEPAVEVEVEYVDVPDSFPNKLIVMRFEPWTAGKQPYTFRACPYYRVESTTKVMPRELYDQRVRDFRPEKYAWEAQAAEGISIADLNKDKIRACIRLGIEGGRVPESAQGEPIEKILAKWKLLSKDGSPNNAAAVLFSDKTEDYPQFCVRMARFVGTDKGEFADNQQKEGNFFELLDASVAFCFKHLSLSGRISGLRREERLEIPYAALREALINALCHRSWETYKLTIGIAIYDDRVEISNPGMLPGELTPKTIKLPHQSYPYNITIAQVLYRATYLESWGSGVGRIVDVCRSAGLEEPEWVCRSGFVSVVFKRPKREATDAQAEFENPSSKPKEPPMQALSTPNAEEETQTYSPQVMQLIELMPNQEGKYIDVKELMARCKLKDRKHFLETYIKPALLCGAIVRLYPQNPKHPRQKYALSTVCLERMKPKGN